MRHLLILPDGSELYSGANEKSAIASVKLTRCVNPDKELTPGGVCAAMLEVTVLDPGGAFSLEAGQEVTLFSVDEAENRTQVGIFIPEAPRRQSAGVYHLTAYDRVSLLDADLGQWLASLTGWPYSLQEFAQLVCHRCGVTLETGDILNPGHQIHAFSGQGITGRQLMRWVCQLAGRFCRARADGVLEFAWFSPRQITVTPSGSRFYYRDGLNCADYQTAPVEKVQLRLSESDLGGIYPDDPKATNTMAITGNYLLTTTDAAALEIVAQALYEFMQGITYTPATVQTTLASGITAGDVFTVRTTAGEECTVYAMTCTQEDGKLTVECTGLPRRDSCSAVNQQSFAAITGKVLNLRADIQGLKVENADARGNLAALEMDLAGITARVNQNTADANVLRQSMTQLQQTAAGLRLSVERIESDGVNKVVTGTGYTFDDAGLTISRQDSPMENLLDNTGMYVRRSGQVILRANTDGVTAVDVSVGNYLVVGDHARFEDYAGGRTACFYL